MKKISKMSPSFSIVIGSANIQRPRVCELVGSVLSLLGEDWISCFNVDSLCTSNASGTLSSWFNKYDLPLLHSPKIDTTAILFEVRFDKILLAMSLTRIYPPLESSTISNGMALLRQDVDWLSFVWSGFTTIVPFVSSNLPTWLSSAYEMGLIGSTLSKTSFFDSSSIISSGLRRGPEADDERIDSFGVLLIWPLDSLIDSSYLCF